MRTDAQATGQGEYDRIVGNADAEIALARQRAVEEAAARLGEIVMEVVERVIGREVDAEAHRDLIDEAVAALRADTSGGAAAAGRGAVSEPDASGVHGRGRSRRPERPRSARSRRDLEAIEQLVLSNPQLRAALTDTSVPGPARRAVMLDLLEGKVSAGGPPARGVRVLVGRRAQDVPAALDWLATAVRHLAEGQDDEPALSLTRPASASAASPPPSSRTCRPPSSRRRGRAVPLRPHRRVATPALRGALTDRDLAVTARAGLVTELLAGKVPATTLALARYAVAGGRARDFVGHARLAGRADGAGPGLAGRPGAARAPIDDAQRSRAHRLARRAGRAPGRAPGRARRVLLSGALIHIGDLRVDATARGRLDALREHFMPPAGSRLGVQPAAATVRQTRQREHSDGRADDRRQRDHRGAASATSRSTPRRSAPSRSAASSRSATASPACRACPAPRSTSCSSSRTARSASR